MRYLATRAAASVARDSICPLTKAQNRAFPVMRHPQFPLEIVECVNTGFQYVDPSPSREALEQLYNEDYNGSFGRDFDADAPDFVGRRADAQLHFLKECGALKGIERAAEVGAGWGALAERLQKKHGIDVHCYELDSAAVAYMNDKRGLSAKVGTLEDDGERPDSSLDLVSSSMMLEHLPDPLDAVKKWRQKIKVGGFLFVEIPLENPVPSWFGADPAKPYWVGHLTFFNRHHLQILVKEAGFDVVRAECFDHPVSPGYVMPRSQQPYRAEDYDVALDTTPVNFDDETKDPPPKLLRLVARRST